MRLFRGHVRHAALALCGLVLVFEMAAKASPYSDFNAGLALRMRDDDLAIQYLSKALADPGLLAAFRPVALRSRARAYDREKKTDLALADYSASLALMPDYNTYMARGFILFHRDNYDAALRDFAAAHALRPDLLDAPMMRARLFVSRDRFEDALVEANELIGIYSRDPGAYAMRASVYRGKGDFDRALTDAAYAISLDEDAPDGYFEKAAIYEDQGKLDDALDAIKDALRKSSNNFDILMKKGVILWEMKKYRDSESAFAAALKQRPANGYAALWLLIAHRNAHGDSDVGDALKDVDTVTWPAPVLAQLRGSEPPDATLAAAHTLEGDRRDQICDAEFYGAQWYLLNHNPGPAEALMAAAVRDCIASSLERTPARLQTWK